MTSYFQNHLITNIFQTDYIKNLLPDSRFQINSVGFSTTNLTTINVPFNNCELQMSFSEEEIESFLEEKIESKFQRIPTFLIFLVFRFFTYHWPSTEQGWGYARQTYARQSYAGQSYARQSYAGQSYARQSYPLQFCIFNSLRPT